MSNYINPRIRGFFCFLDLLLGRIFLGFFAIYRILFSPDHSFWAKLLAKPPYCKHIPSCSSYAILSIERFWGIRWWWLAFQRLGRCVPWRAGGYDPVPELPTDHSQCKHTVK